MTDYKSYFEANRDIWNQRTIVHKDSSFYDAEAFKAGENMLKPIELTELGDVGGKKMLHLQCHFGIDSLCWARMGAKVTGVDLSDEAINEARKLNNELKLDAEFICANVYDLHPESEDFLKTHSELKESFDIVFTSYGTIGWLPDLQKWAEIIRYYLKPGGVFYIAEFHPVLWMFDDEFKHIKYAYENQELIITENMGTYTDREAPIKGKEYSWNHSLSEVINSLIGQGLRIVLMNEHMYSPYSCFSNLVEFEKGKWHVKGMEGKIPMVYSIKAVKPVS